MIPQEVAAEILRKSSLPESVAASTLLASSRPSRADIRCFPEKHVLARIYSVDGRLVLAVPANVFLRAEFDTGTEPDDLSEIAFVPWLYELDGSEADESASIYVRCACHTYWTSVTKVRDQLANLAPGDRWIGVSIAKRRKARG